MSSSRGLYNPLVRLVTQRIALGLGTLLGASILIFAGTQLLPGDVAEAILGQAATPEAVANLRRDLGLNEPAITRYFKWLFGVLTGDLGVSLSNGQSIAGQLGSRMSNTLVLAGVTALVSVPLSIAFGLLAVLYRNRWPDKLISGTGLALTAMPEFFIGYVLIFFFAVKLQWLTAVSTTYDGMSLWERLSVIILPVMVLASSILAHMMRMTRAAILNVMQSAYIETAELKGLTGAAIIWRHAMPNALAPIINVVMLNLAFLIVGVVVVEVVFAYPGMGQYLVDHVAKRDLPVVQTCGLIFSAIFIGMNIIADVAGIFANPRLRHPK
jgi:peptide/nickel transport system permease protein